MLYLRVDNDAENDLVADLGNAALSWCERYCDGTFAESMPDPVTDRDSEYISASQRIILFTPDIWQAVMLLTAYWYANREAAGAAESEQPFSVTAILDRRRLWSGS